LKWIAEGGSQAGVPAPVINGRKGPLRDIRVAWSVAAVFLIVLALGGFAYFRRAPQDVLTARFLFCHRKHSWARTRTPVYRLLWRFHPTAAESLS
jgi:hypothetical protein